MEKEILNFFWQIIENISPSIFWGGVVLLFGIIFAKWMERLVVGFLKTIKLNQILKRMGWEEAFSKIEISFDAITFLGKVVKWFFVLICLMATFEVLGLPQFSQFLEKVISYFPNIFVAGIIFMVAVFLADFSQKIVVGTLEKEKITYSVLLGRAIRWTIWLFAILAILYQLKITPPLILAIFVGIVATISLAVGIALGLGGKDLAAKAVKELEEKFK